MGAGDLGWIVIFLGLTLVPYVVVGWLIKALGDMDRAMWLIMLGFAVLMGVFGTYADISLLRSEEADVEFELVFIPIYQLTGMIVAVPVAIVVWVVRSRVIVGLLPVRRFGPAGPGAGTRRR